LLLDSQDFETELYHKIWYSPSTSIT